jgi:F-type H+-transporting ATPase subunit b
LTFEFTTFLYAIIAFGILYYFLSKKAFGPLFNMMEKRREHVLNELSAAENNRKEAIQLLADQKDALNNARKEAYDIIEQSRTVSAKQADEMLAKAREEAGRINAEAIKNIEIEKNKAIAALRSQVSAMSVMIASKIIEKQVDEKSQEQLIEHYLKEVGGQS